MRQGPSGGSSATARRASGSIPSTPSGASAALMMEIPDASEADLSGMGPWKMPPSATRKAQDVTSRPAPPRLRVSAHTQAAITASGG